MKKINLYTIVLTVLILSCFIINKTLASGSSVTSDKWKVVSVKGPTSCKLNSHSFKFRVKIKNAGDIKSTGQSISLKITMSGNGYAEYEEVALTPSKIAAGKSTVLSACCTNENFKRFTNAAGNKQVSVKVEVVGVSNSSLIEEVDFKVK